MNYIRRLINTINSLSVNTVRIGKNTDELKLLTAKTLITSQKIHTSIQDAEFKVFSQWGDDGIIQYLINHVQIENKIFVEFGVENYTEANTRFLLINDNWSGLVMDGSEQHIDFIKKDEISWRYDLTAKAAFIDAENVNDLISSAGITGNIGILHIDIDGNDYWVWKNMKAVDADIVIVEYNSTFGRDRAITVPYDPAFQRTKAHYSNLYYGASLTALCDLAEEKEYYFVGCNSAGNNAYFVKKTKIGILKRLSASEGFVAAKFRESRNEKGELTFLTGTKKIEVIKNLKVMNTRTHSIESI